MSKPRLKHLEKIVVRINSFDSQVSKLSDSDLRAKTDQFKQRLANGETLDDLLPEAFAVVRETGERTIGLRHYDYQLIAGIALHQRLIAEICAGEGKTLTATLPVYLNSLTGQGVHVVTLNNQLARRDAEWMGDLYNCLGITVGVIDTNMEQAQRYLAYQADVTYGCSNAFIFDYLRDNMVYSLDKLVQRDLHFAIVDDADSILIDQVLTPPKITEPEKVGTGELYLTMVLIAKDLSRRQGIGNSDYFLEDEDSTRVYLTDKGRKNIETILLKHRLLQVGETLYDAENRLILLHHLNAALLAHVFYKKDIDYVVSDQQIQLVNKATGQLLVGHRWKNGVHEAIEAREGVPVQQKSEVAAEVTVHNYFRLYQGLAGMSGTAESEAVEFQTVYGLDVFVVPGHHPNVRNELPDLIFLTEREKFDAAVEDIVDCVRRGQPVIVNTMSNEKSRYLEELLSHKRINSNILDFQNMDQHAELLSQAGQPNSVTITTNLACQGNDLVLGNSLSGGLHVIGVERQNVRRLDNKLCSFAARRGDPGSCRFYMSLEDDLMRLFASDKVKTLMKNLGMEEGEAIEHPWVSKSVKNAQHKIEVRNFELRTQLLAYDDVANVQRIKYYSLRKEILTRNDLADTVQSKQRAVIDEIVDILASSEINKEHWNVSGLMEVFAQNFNLPLKIDNWFIQDRSLSKETLKRKIYFEFDAAYQSKKAQIGSDTMRQLEKSALLQCMDKQWKAYLAAMELQTEDNYLLDKITSENQFRGYKKNVFSILDLATKMPMIRKKGKSFVQKHEEREHALSTQELFDTFQRKVAYQFVSCMAKVEIKDESSVDDEEIDSESEDDIVSQLEETNTESESFENIEKVPRILVGKKVRRLEVCPCGSGKRYKDCHGAIMD